MQTVLSITGVVVGLIAAGVGGLTVAQWTAMRGAERPTAILLIGALLIAAIGLTLFARGLS
jgi:hypothetical protein